MLVVDDSVFMRRLISDMIGRFPGFQVIGASADGRDALRDIDSLDPDIVTLDIEMPRLDGFGVLRNVMESNPRPIVVLSAYTDEGSKAALKALDLGAVDFVPKPSGPVSFDVAKVEAQLHEALRAAAAADLDAVRRDRRPRKEGRPSGAAEEHRAVVAIAASTGGPQAISHILSALPGRLGAAVLIVQHMPAGFTSTLASRLDEISELRVSEAAGGEEVIADRAWIAPGDFHMSLRRVGSSVKIALDRRDPVWGTRPAADPLFASVAEVYGERSVGVVLTGMGRDGSAGLGAIREAGGRTLAQDRASSVVYGMPGRAMDVGAAERAVALSEIPQAILASLAGLPAAPVRRSS